MASNSETADRRACAAAAARDDRLQHRLVGIHAGRDIGDRDADPRRRFRAAGDRGQSALGLHQKIISFRAAGTAADLHFGDEAGLSQRPHVVIDSPRRPTQVNRQLARRGAVEGAKRLEDLQPGRGDQEAGLAAAEHERVWIRHS